MTSVKLVVKEMLLKQIQNKQNSMVVIVVPVSSQSGRVRLIFSLGDSPQCVVHTCVFMCKSSYGEIRTTLEGSPAFYLF